MKVSELKVGQSFVYPIYSGYSNKAPRLVTVEYIPKHQRYVVVKLKGLFESFCECIPVNTGNNSLC